jgi:hypothetical protein
MMVRKPDVFKDDAHLGREIFDQFRFNYGWAGPMFIKAVYKTGELGVSKLLDQWCLRFKKDFGEDTAYRFYENVVAVAMASGEISNAAGITKFDLDRVYRRIVGEMIAIRDNVVKVNSVNYESILSDYINRNQSGILAFKDNKITMEPRLALVIRVENDINMMYISKTEFDKYLTEGGVSTKEFLFQINALGIKVDAIYFPFGTIWATCNESSSNDLNITRPFVKSIKSKPILNPKTSLSTSYSNLIKTSLEE